jgi:hypothetical protein
VGASAAKHYVAVATLSAGDETLVMSDVIFETASGRQMKVEGVRR